MSNIIILAGSERKDGNTDMLVDAFRKGAVMKIHSLWIILVQEMCSSLWMHHLLLSMELLSIEIMGKVRGGIQTKLYHVLRFKFMKNRLQPCQ